MRASSIWWWRGKVEGLGRRLGRPWRRGRHRRINDLSTAEGAAFALAHGTVGRREHLVAEALALLDLTIVGALLVAWDALPAEVARLALAVLAMRRPLGDGAPRLAFLIDRVVSKGRVAVAEVAGAALAELTVRVRL